MGQFSLFENNNPETKATYPYFVDVQNDLLDSLNSRLVIPLVSTKTVKDRSIAKLCPVAVINDKSYALMTQQMTSVPFSALKVPAGSLGHMRGEIIAAIDFLITGI
jgi:toxin CcdB